MGKLSDNDRERVQNFLKMAQSLYPTNQYTIIQNSKNKGFDNKYNLLSNQKLEILKSLNENDFVGIKKNDNKKYPDADMFIFIKDVTLDCYGIEEFVKLYIKAYIIDQGHMDMVIVLSFHEEGVYDD